MFGVLIHNEESEESCRDFPDGFVGLLGCEVVAKHGVFVPASVVLSNDLQHWRFFTSFRFRLKSASVGASRIRILFFAHGELRDSRKEHLEADDFLIES
jgi:hypothetical protein